ncbi:MAG: Ig-like domain-containing protein [Planctomycetota bacterium]
MLETKFLKHILCLVVLLSISVIIADATEGEGVMTEEDTPVSITLLGSDPDGDPLTYTVVTGPSHGRLSGKAPKLTYTPQPNFNGKDSFTFNVNDGTVDGVPVTVLIMVKAVNDPPTANDGSVTTQEDTLVSITLAGCDPDGDALSYSVVKDPSHGSLSGTGPNLTYTPNANFNGSDSFLFKVNDGTVDSAAATVSIQLKPVNDPPTASYVGATVQNNPPAAKDNSVTTEEDTPVSITLEGSDPDEDELSYTVVESPSHGSLSGTAPNMSYTPNPNFNGSDSFTFKVSDETAESDAAIVSITVRSANDTPSAKDDSARTQEDAPIEAIDVLANDTDVDNEKLTTSAVTQGRNGSVTINADNTLSYSPKANFCGTDSFTYTVSDGKGGTDTATVNVKVKAVNDAPTANDDSVWTHEDMPIVEIDVLANDTDIEDDPLKISAVTQGKNGSVSIDTDNTLRYAPKANFFGSDSFTYTVYDGKDGTDTATVNVKVKAVNDAPSLTSTPLTTATVDALYTYDVDAADPDAGDTLTYSLTIKPAGMTIDTATGLIEWTPASAQAGANDVAVKVVDNGSVPASQTQSFTITASLPSTPATTVLSTTDDFNPKKCKTILSAACKGGIIQASDDNRGETESGLYTSYDFSDVSIPAGVEIASVVVYVEHFEQEQFPVGKLQWAAGTGWPSNPVVWASINAPVYEGEPNEATDLWDVTSLVDTPEKVNSLQLQVRNNDDVTKRKTLVDCIYAVVEWN